MTACRSRGVPKQRRAQLTRRTILTAAATEFDLVGYEAAALNAILRRSGTTGADPAAVARVAYAALVGTHTVGPDFAGLPERVAEAWRVVLAGEGVLRELETTGRS